MKVGFKKYLYLILALHCLSDRAFAEGAAAGAISLMYGISVPDSDNTNAMRIMGAKGMALISPNFSIGGYYLVTGNDEGTGGRKFEYTLNGIEPAFHIPSGSGDTFLSVRVGSTKIRTDDQGVDLIFSPYHYGFSAGYSYSLASWIGFGFEGSFIYVEKSKTSLSGIHYSEDAFSIIQFLGMISFQL